MHLDNDSEHSLYSVIVLYAYRQLTMSLRRYFMRRYIMVKKLRNGYAKVARLSTVVGIDN